MKDTINRVLIWRFTSVLIKINYGQIGNQTGLFYTTNPVFYTSGNRFVRRTGVIEPFPPIVSFPPRKNDYIVGFPPEKWLFSGFPPERMAIY